jgi:hypothetical protein
MSNSKSDSALLSSTTSRSASTRAAAEAATSSSDRMSTASVRDDYTPAGTDLSRVRVRSSSRIWRRAIP